MKLKYYLRGMGIGIILTAIVMGFALGGRKAAMSDAEIINRAKALGMVEAQEGVLTSNNDKESAKNENDTSASDEALDQKGEEVSKKDNEAVNEADSSIFEVAQAPKEEQTTGGENSTVPADSQGSKTDTENTIIETKVPEVNEASVTSETEQDAASAGNQDNAANSQQTESASNNDTEQNTQTTATSTDTTNNTQSSATNNDTANNEQAPAPEPQPETPKVQGKTIVIPGGSDSDRVAEILYNEGFVDSSVGFNQYLVESGQDRRIRSGTKVIPEGASYEQIAAIITSG